MVDYSIAGSSGTTGLSHWAAPTLAGKLAVVDPSDTTTAPAGANGSDKWASIGQLLGVAGYVSPSGDTSGATDIAAINNIIGTSGGACILAPAPSTDTGGTPFYVNAPLAPALGASLRGAMPWSAVDADAYGPSGGGHSGGSVIHAVSAFSGAAVLDMNNTTATQLYGVSLANFTLECWGTPTAGGVKGIRVHGAWGACIMDGVCVNLPDGDCLHFEADATQGTSPDDWYVSRCKFSASRSANGVWADNIPDSWFIDCESSEHALDDWQLGFSLNTRLTSCKGENSSGGAGFHLAGQGGSGRFITLTGCSTHLNNKDGFLFDGTASGSSAGGVYMLANCVAVSDGQAGGTTFAGFRSTGSVNKVIGSNCLSVGAPNGASQVSTSAGMDFDHSSITGTTANLHDDGSNTSALVSRNSPDQKRVTLGTAFNSGTGTSAQTVTGMAVTLPAGIWNVTAWIPMTTHGTLGGTQTLAWTFGGTASAAVVSWTISGTTVTGSGGTAVTTASAASPVMTAAGMLGQFSGKVTVTASGTLQLTTTSGTTGDEVTIPVGAWINAEQLAV